MKELQLLVKPASSLCNMRCSYCFYEDEASRRKVPSYGIMAQDVMEATVKNALGASSSCVFGFQGGEPTLAGISFFKEFIETVDKNKLPGQKVSYTIQTNGLGLNKQWMDFFKENNFLVGVSMDGIKAIHDRNRKDAHGGATFSVIEKNALEMLKMGIPVNILCVLTKQAAKKAYSIYQYLKKTGFYYQQYIPCMDPLEEEEARKPYALSGEEYCNALKTLFDLWAEDKMSAQPVFVRTFDNWLHVLGGGIPEACAMYGKCTMQNVVEADGSIYPCDFYVLDEYCMGNVKTDSFRELWEQSAEEKGFFKEAAVRDSRCPSCRWYPLCRGGCRRDCFTKNNIYINKYCEAYQEFFAYAAGTLERLVSVKNLVPGYIPDNKYQG